jgi:5-methyltetrahydrofolate--homocysteine methyltransferase
MVSSSNSVTDYVPLANMKAMFDATFEFGEYPIALEEGRVKGKVWTYLGKGKAKAAAVAPVELNLDAYVTALLSAKAERVIELFKKDMGAGVPAGDVVGKGLIPAMTVVGERFQSGQIYIPEMMIAAKTMGATLAHFKDLLVSKAAERKGKVIIGTVKGDLHDIGKNLVAMMLEGQGFSVEDLGVSVGPEKFVQAVKEKAPDILCMSALLTTTMIEMRNVISALQAAGLREKVKVMVGGAPVTQKFADQIGADGYAYDAPGAAQRCKELLAIP